jgi:hypothetical protein
MPASHGLIPEAVPASIQGETEKGLPGQPFFF